MKILSHVKVSFVFLILLTTTSTCSRSALQGTPALLSVSGSTTFDQVSLLNTDTQTLTFTNNGQTQAKNLAMTGMAGFFGFYGGTYPGTGGSCGSTLAPGASCTMVLSYSPTSGVAHSGNALFSYSNGKATEAMAFGMNGTAIPQGSLDTSFGTAGKVELDWGDDETIVKILVRSDDKIVVVGHANSGVTSDENILLARLNPDGALDTSFGIGGKIDLDLGGNDDDIAYSAALTPDDKIVIAGTSDTQPFLVRLQSDGSLDSTFGLLPGISLITKLVALNTEPSYDIALQNDGKILFSGESNPVLGPPLFNAAAYVSRWDDAGLLPDLTYGLLGTQTVDYAGSVDSRSQTMALATDQSLAIGGYTSNGATKNSAIARLDAANGALNTAFDGDGKRVLDMCGAALDDEITDLTITSVPSVKIFASGYCNVAGVGKNAFATKFNADGSLDTTFNTTGIYNKNISGFDDVHSSLMVDSSGKVTLAGHTNNGTKDLFLMIRLTAAGAEDPLFGTAGIQTTAVGTGSARALTMATQSTGKILLGGYSTNASRDFAITRYFP